MQIPSITEAMNPSLFRVDHTEREVLVIGAVTSIWHCSALGVKDSASVCEADKWALTHHTRRDRRSQKQPQNYFM